MDPDLGHNLPEDGILTFHSLPVSFGLSLIFFSIRFFFSGPFLFPPEDRKSVV